jgi:hypothetical protein
MGLAKNYIWLQEMFARQMGAKSTTGYAEGEIMIPDVHNSENALGIPCMHCLTAICTESIVARIWRAGSLTAN